MALPEFKHPASAVYTHTRVVIDGPRIVASTSDRLVVSVSVLDGDHVETHVLTFERLPENA